MTVSNTDRETLRRLAARQAEIGQSPVHKEKAELWRKLNDLEPTRPLVMIYEICWHELEKIGEMRMEIEDRFLRKVEEELRRTIYQWERLPVDMVVDDTFHCPVVVDRGHFGIERQGRMLQDSPERTPSRHYEPQIKSEADVAKIEDPVVTVDWEETERRFELLNDIFGDVLAVEKRAAARPAINPWDELIQWWGVEEAFMDLALKPDLVHMAMDRLMTAIESRLDQYEALNLLQLNNRNINTGSGGYGYTSQLPQPDYDPTRVRPKDMWASSMAQIFTDVSPEMHVEFAIDYEIRYLKRFGLNYYGCCEPLDRKVDVLRKIPNLRKISMSPWADKERAAEKIGRDFVFSLKPNPAIVAEDNWRPERARAALRRDLEAARGCAVEVILKDITTIRYDPKRLWDWGQLAMETVEEFAP